MDPNQAVVLCVDDDAATLALLQGALEAADFTVLSAENGCDALALAYTHRPDLVLLDLRLPDLPGEEVCRRLRCHAHTARIPIIMLTVKDGEAAKLLGFELGADDYVTKPFSAPILIARIRAHLRRKAAEA